NSCNVSSVAENGRFPTESFFTYGLLLPGTEMHVAERAGKPEDPCGRPEVRSHIGISRLVMQTSKPGDRNGPFSGQRHRRGNCPFLQSEFAAPGVGSKPSLYKYNACEKVIACAHFAMRTED